MDICLGFDTSCYTTSAAAVGADGAVLVSSRMLLPVDAGQRGLRQSEAVFVHVKQMPRVMERLRASLPENARIVCVCASSKPRDGEDSYMPVFTVGLGHARVLADALQVPLFETTHQRGHIAAGMIGLPAMPEPLIALHLSGGTTEMLLCQKDELKLIGGSLDLHAGQMVDRIGVKLGLSFPAGPALESLAVQCTEATEALLPLSMEQDGRYCHLSGAETQAMRLIERGGYSPQRIAAEVYDLLGRTVARMLAAGCKSDGAARALVVGGVASSQLLRRLIAQRLGKQRYPVQLSFGEPQYSGDNAAGVAKIGIEQYLSTIDGKGE